MTKSLIGRNGQRQKIQVDEFVDESNLETAEGYHHETRNVTSDLVDSYLREVRRYGLLPKEKELELARAAVGES